MDLIQRENH